jgi:hypothetical protein
MSDKTSSVDEALLTAPPSLGRDSCNWAGVLAMLREPNALTHTLHLYRDSPSVVKKPAQPLQVEDTRNALRYHNQHNEYIFVFRKMACRIMDKHPGWPP